MSDVVIVSAARTPVGRFLGGLAAVSASELGAVAIRATLKRANVRPDQVDEVIMGQVLTAGCGQNPARQAAISAEVPETATSVQVNQLCGSGLRAVAMAAQSLALGDCDIVVAGGQESMSQSPHFAHIRQGQKMGSLELQDSMMIDGLHCAFGDCAMGVTAENIAQRWKFSRQDQDDFALHSQQKACEAQKKGLFVAEIAPVTVMQRRKELLISEDEHLKPETTAESLAGHRAVFAQAGTVTAGNASGINDGAAACVLMRRETATSLGITPMASILSWATSGVAPEIMGTGPIPASQKALVRAGLSIEDIDRIEANEAFAAQALAVNQEMAWDTERVNPTGGAIALGHPIGASGARILTTLLYGMQRDNQHTGLATLCIGGGMGIAMVLQREKGWV